MTTAFAAAAAPRRGRSVLAVVAGFLTTAILSTAMDAVMHASHVFPALGAQMSDRLFGLATTYRVAFTVLGGFVTASLAPSRPMRHAWILAAIGTLGGAAGIAVWMHGGPEMGPLWYPVALLVTAVPSVLAGGRLGVGS